MTIPGEGKTEAATARAVPWRAGLAAAGTSVMFGFVPLAARGLYADGLSTGSLLCWRYLLALVVIFAGIRLARLRLGAALRQGAWRIALVGVSLGAVQTLCYFQSLRRLDTGIAVLLFYTFPVVTLGVERFFFKQPVATAALLCVIVILAGAALIAGPGLHNGTIDPRGLAWAVPGPVIYAFYLAANARLMARHPPLIGAGFLYGGLAAAYLGAALWLGASLPKSAAGWLSLAFLALGPGAVAAVAQSYSMPRLGPATYAIIANCELVTVVVVGAAVLGEKLTPTRALGGGLILAGILLYGWGRTPPRDRTAENPRVAARRPAAGRFWRSGCAALLLVLLPAALAAQQWTQTEPPIDLAHIDMGEINRHGEPVGYHHRANGIDPPSARVLRIVQPPDANGVYRARVELRDPATGAWLDKRAASTFFPDAMSDAEVVAAVLAAFGNGHVRRDGRFVGRSGRGFVIEGWYRSGRILAAYPLRGP